MDERKEKRGEGIYNGGKSGIGLSTLVMETGVWGPQKKALIKSPITDVSLFLLLSTIIILIHERFKMNKEMLYSDFYILFACVDLGN